MSPLKSPALLGGLLALTFAPVAGAAPKGKAPAGKAGEPALAPKVVPVAKAPPACGAKILPLAVGNEWTYEAVGARDVKTGADILPDDSIKAFVPKQPKSVVITVKSIEPAKAGDKNGDTVVTLEEKYTIDLTKVKDEKPVLWDRTLTTTITCNGKNKFEISPDSFFFAGEPGGYFDLTFDKFDRSKGTDLQLTNGGIGDQPWGEDIVAHWKRSATPGSNAELGTGKLELERRFTPQPQERVNTKLGVVTTEKLGIKTTGRVTLDNTAQDLPGDWTSKDGTCKVLPAGLQCELPANWITQIWIANGTGVIATLNPYAHMYQLADVKLK